MKLQTGKMFEMVKVTIANTLIITRCIYANNMMPKVRGIIVATIIPSLPPIVTLPRKENVMEDKARNYTVSSCYENNQERPFIRIKGKWLEKLGFKVGNKLKIYEANNVLLIVKEK